MLISHKGGQQYHPKVNTNGTVDREYYFETRFPKGNKGNSNFAILRGRYSQATCRIDLDPTHIWSGVPEHFLGRRSSIQLDYRERMKTVDQDANQVKKLRNNVRTWVIADMKKSMRNIKQGTYDILRYPYYWIDARVSSVSGSSNDENRIITVRQVDSTSSVNTKVYGVKVGDVVRAFGTDSTYATEETYGYINALHPSDGTQLYINFPEGTTTAGDIPSAGDYIRIYVQARTGTTIRVDNTLANIAGNHMIVESSYHEMSGRATTSVKSIGEEDDRPYESGVTRRYEPGDKAWEVQKDSSSTFTETVPRATMLVDFSGTFSTGYYSLDIGAESNTLVDTVSVVRWSSGRLKLGGRSYRISAGSTYSSLRGQVLPATTSLMSDDYMPFYIYFDPIANNSGFSAIYVFCSDISLIPLYTPSSLTFK